MTAPNPTADQDAVERVTRLARNVERNGYFPAVDQHHNTWAADLRSIIAQLADAKEKLGRAETGWQEAFQIGVGWQSRAATAEKERDDLLARLRPPEGEFAKLFTMAHVAGGHPADTDDQSFDAQVGREFIKHRLAVVDRLATNAQLLARVGELEKWVADTTERADYILAEMGDRGNSQVLATAEDIDRNFAYRRGFQAGMVNATKDVRALLQPKPEGEGK